jgi:hypothetical protein
MSIKLLELAAKAADLELKELTGWNPLFDDGDALRLAVKLKMDVTVGQSVKVVCATNDGLVSKIVLPMEDGGDDYAVVRRAIVNAAADIGKEK